ncbi:hypothetical protein CC86DRAFT_204550 [Ophiobolus disseminans]|uniref:RING-type domain-containing protein n=1 Tax=Ophiobolus disseminans TaxID=1469910 RepID=A0A6A7A483_9PLEO|nr:hypothetical protein CC86DRAFT_204550 [Ophiobolus disseminans]
MTEFEDVSTFFHRGIANLGDNHYTTNDTVCNICQEGDMTGDESSSAPVVQIRRCLHMFHKVCLAEWAVCSFRDSGSATCPMCRAVLVREPNLNNRENSNAPTRQELQVFLRERLARTIAHTPQTLVEEYEQAKEIIRIAVATRRHLDLYINPVRLRTAMIFVEDYEAAHPFTRVRNRLDGCRYRISKWCARRLGLRYTSADIHFV